MCLLIVFSGRGAAFTLDKWACLVQTCLFLALFFSLFEIILFLIHKHQHHVQFQFCILWICCLILTVIIHWVHPSNCIFGNCFSSGDVICANWSRAGTGMLSKGVIAEKEVHNNLLSSEKLKFASKFHQITFVSMWWLKMWMWLVRISISKPREMLGWHKELCKTDYFWSEGRWEGSFPPQCCVISQKWILWVHSG